MRVLSMPIKLAYLVICDILELRGAVAPCGIG